MCKSVFYTAFHLQISSFSKHSLSLYFWCQDFQTVFWEIAMKMHKSSSSFLNILFLFGSWRCVNSSSPSDLWSSAVPQGPQKNTANTLKHADLLCFCAAFPCVWFSFVTFLQKDKWQQMLIFQLISWCHRSSSDSGKGKRRAFMVLHSLFLTFWYCLETFFRCSTFRTALVSQY